MNSKQSQQIYSVVITKYDPSINPPYETWSIDIVPGRQADADFVGTKEECEQYKEDYEEYRDGEVY